MTDQQTDKKNRSHALQQAVRDLRRRYDKLERGKTAPIRRCKTADEVALEGIYWRLGAELARENTHLPHVVLLFPLAPHATHKKFSFGRYLRAQLGDSDGAALRFRRLLDSHDREELDHRLRAILRLAASDKKPVDWGVLGVDVLWFFAESDNVRRHWAQDFYAPTARDASPDVPTPATAPSSNS